MRNIVEYYQNFMRKGNFMEIEKKVKVLTILVVVFGVIILGLGSYIALNPTEKETNYSDDNKNDGDDTENKDNTGNNNTNNDNITAIESRVFASIPILEGFVNYRGMEDKGQNIIGSAKNRLELINYYFMQNGVNWTSDEEVQSAPYEKFDEYRAKYNEFYGSNYNFTTDTSNADGPVYNNCSSYDSLEGGNYVCWNGTWGMTGCDLKMTYKNKSISNDVYTLIEDYKLTCQDGSVETGTVEIQYNIANGKETLKSIKVQ